MKIVWEAVWGTGTEWAGGDKLSFGVCFSDCVSIISPSATFYSFKHKRENVFSKFFAKRLIVDEGCVLAAGKKRPPTGAYVLRVKAKVDGKWRGVEEVIRVDV